MRKEIKIGEISVTFESSASTPLRYRRLFGSDLIRDMESVQQTNDTEPVLKLAYVMAKQADSTISDDIVEWLDQFDMIPFFESLPQLIALYTDSNKTLETSKKK